jgi:hypothetical protein
MDRDVASQYLCRRGRRGGGGEIRSSLLGANHAHDISMGSSKSKARKGKNVTTATDLVRLRALELVHLGDGLFVRSTALATSHDMFGVSAGKHKAQFRIWGLMSMVLGPVGIFPG